MPIELAVIPLSAIKLDVRQREVHENIDKLAESLKTYGMIHPLAVMAYKDGYKLIAGGRRYLACKAANIEEVPVTVYPETLSKLERKEIELEENLQREDITWQESVKATAEIDAIKKKLHGIGVTGERTDLGDTGHTQADTARALGVSESKVSRDIALAKVIDLVPEIARAKTPHEAMRILNTIRYEAEVKVAAEAILAIQEDPLKAEAGKKALINSYHVEDFFEAAKALPGGCCNLIEVDPPYGIDLGDVRRFGLANYQDIPEKDYPDFIDQTLKECFRLLTNGWILVWHSSRWEHLIREKLLKYHFALTYVPAIWHKKAPGFCRAPQYYFGNAYEPFYYARKGNAVIHAFHQGRSNVFEFKGVPREEPTHPTQRPIELMREIIKCFQNPNLTKLLVPFLGGGNTLLAANNLNIHNAWGYDIYQPFKDTFVKVVGTGMLHDYKSYKL